MIPLNNLFILAAAFLVVFLESTFDGVRNLLGAQIDFLPSLIVYTSLTHGLLALTLLSVLGGMWFDSMSANPLGITILPLFAVGLVLHYYRSLILRDQLFAQSTLGLAASATAPVLTLLLLLNMDTKPLLGWASLWQWIVVSLAGAAVTPLWFRLFDRVSLALNYRPVGETTFRSDREIKRSRHL